jgi:hypothetical protein
VLGDPLIIRGVRSDRPCPKQACTLDVRAQFSLAAVCLFVEGNRRSIMHDPIRGIRYAALAGAAVLLSFAAMPAEAQGVPGGSYLQSCTNVRMLSDRLVADCRRADGSWERTALHAIGHCIGGIVNANGQLTCNHLEPGYGSSYDRPFGPTQDRYYGYPRYFGYGR